MKNTLLIISIFFTSSCFNSLTKGGLENTGSNIADKNFRYISKVQGEATSDRLFNMRVQEDSGGLYARAMNDITVKTNLYHGSKKGLINVTYDYRVDTYFLIYSIETVTITADVVEYLD